MNIARRIYRIISTVLVSLVVVLAVLLVGVRLVGLTPYTVISGSMEPTYPVGCLLYVQKVDPTTLQEGDPVTYHMSGGQVVTHRIIEVVEDPSVGVCYRTKGDANNIEDNALLKYTQVIGRPLFHIPKLGYLSHFIQNPPGTYIAIAVVLVLLSLGSLIDVLFPEGEKKEESSEEELAPTAEEGGE